MLAFLSSAQSFVATARPLLRAAPTHTAPAPVMTLDLDLPTTALANIPATTLIAEDNTLLLASMVGSLVLILGIVAAVVTRTLTSR